jgi:uncharacterized protein (DUF433 family)
MVSVILDNLANNVKINELLKNYPSLTAEDVYAALHYAASELPRN